MNRTDKILEALGIKIAKRRGRRAWTHCPFHESVTPTTFFIRTAGERAGQYHCFSCKASGPLFKLVAKVRDCDDETAREFILDAGQGHEPPRARVRVTEGTSSYGRRVFKFPKEVIVKPFDQWDTLPQRYIAERGITPQEIDTYGIGYAVDGPLAGRIVFPVRTHAGQIVSYSGRTFVDEDPKYKTPNADEHANLDVLFGEHLWPPLKERNEVLVTEGAIDKIAARRVSGMVTGSLGGSDVRLGHVLSLATFRRIYLMTDADPPGDKAARELHALLVRHVDATIRIRLPGTDAASLALSNPKRLKSKIELVRKRTP